VKILGIDPGYDIIGWSVIDNDFKLCEYGIIKTDPSHSFDDRLHDIHIGLNHILDLHTPETAAIERLFFQRNTTTAIDVAKAIGVIQLTLRIRGISLCDYTPTQVKKAVTGYGKAEKAQVQHMIKTIFSIKEIPKPDDAADAVAIAACHYLSVRR